MTGQSDFQSDPVTKQEVLDMLPEPLEPVWKDGWTNTYEVNLGTWTAQVSADDFPDGPPTDEQLIDSVMERIAESYLDFTRHGRFDISELELIEVEEQ